MGLVSTVKSFFRLGKRKRAKPRHTASTSRELDKEFVDFVVKSPRKPPPSASEPR